RNEFQPVLDGFEVVNCLPDSIGRTAHESRSTDGREHILEIMRSFQRDLRDLQNVALPCAVTENNHAVPQPGALLDFLLAAEPEDLGTGTDSHSHTGRIVSIEDGEIAFLLVLENSRLGVGVNLKRAMAIEVIGRDVQYHRNFGAKGLNRLQLEA